MDVFLSNSRPCIRHYHADAFPVGACNPECAAIRHGILGVEEQVQKNLLQPPGIPVDWGKMSCEFIFYLDLRSLELVLQQRQGVMDDTVHVNLRELGAAGAREVQQVVDNLRSTEGLPRDFL